MPLSDCVKCWETPCVCGYEYETRTREYRYELAAAVLNVQVEELKKLFPNVPNKSRK